MFPKGLAIAMDLRLIATNPTWPLSALQFARMDLFNGENPAILIIATNVTSATQLSAMTLTIPPTSSYDANATVATFIAVRPLRVRCLVLSCNYSMVTIVQRPLSTGIVGTVIRLSVIRARLSSMKRNASVPMAK